MVRLSYREKVSVATMKEILLLCLQEKLTGVQYEVKNPPSMNEICGSEVYLKLFVFSLPSNAG